MAPTAKAESSLRSRANASTSSTAPAHTPRASRNRKPVVDESTSSEEDVEGDENADEDDNEEEEDEEDEVDDEEDDEEDNEGEDEDAEGEDVDMEDSAIAPPSITTNKVSAGVGGKSKTLSATGKGNNRTLAEDDEDEELSDLESMDEDDEDAAGRENRGRVRGGGVNDEEEEEEEEDGEGDSDIGNDEVSFPVSRGDTPDLSKLTRRQRAAYEDLDGGLMALSNGID